MRDYSSCNYLFQYTSNRYINVNGGIRSYRSNIGLTAPDQNPQEWKNLSLSVPGTKGFPMWGASLVSSHSWF